MPYSVHHQPWPTYDPALTQEEVVEVVVQVNGKVRDRLMLPVDLPEPEVQARVLAQPKIAEALNGREPRRVVYVPGRLINIVVYDPHPNPSHTAAGVGLSWFMSVARAES
jgi:leucyl-tRNA synthetase